MTTSDRLRRAMTLADQHGMVLVQSPGDERLANIRCKACGWPGREFDALIERFVKEPHGCPCEGQGTEAERLA